MVRAANSGMVLSGLGRDLGRGRAAGLADTTATRRRRKIYSILGNIFGDFVGEWSMVN